jgi:hypothetical protein
MSGTTCIPGRSMTRAATLGRSLMRTTISRMRVSTAAARLPPNARLSLDTLRRSSVARLVYPTLMRGGTFGTPPRLLRASQRTLELMTSEKRWPTRLRKFMSHASPADTKRRYGERFWKPVWVSRQLLPTLRRSGQIFGALNAEGLRSPYLPTVDCSLIHGMSDAARRAVCPYYCRESK